MFHQKPHNVYYLGVYYSKKYYPRQNEFSLNLINLKENRLSAKYFFSNLLAKYTSKINKKYILVCCPNSDPKKPNPMHRIIEMLCEKNPNLVNGAKMLFRIKQKNSFCRGAKRSYLDIYFDTYVNYLHPIANNRFILLDDVLTTGTTLAACRAILLELGADSVTCLALAYTKLVFEKPEKYF